MKSSALSRTVSAAAALAGLLALAGCASFNTWSADVATFGNWPAGRVGASYAFERLPSQQNMADETQHLEDAARPALAKAGFQPVADGVEPDVLVQLGARVSRTDLAPWDDPLWWPGGLGYGYGRHGGWRGGYWGGYGGGAWGGYWGRGPYWGTSMVYATPRYDREVAVLIRDRASGKPLYEARASSEGFQRNAGPVLLPLFSAALTDFPATSANPRRVTVPLPPE